jgi:hypothetical protein
MEGSIRQAPLGCASKKDLPIGTLEGWAFASCSINPLNKINPIMKPRLMIFMGFIFHPD